MSVATRKQKTTLVALTSFVGKDANDEEHLVRQGEKLASDHPVVKKHPALFGPEQEAEG